MTIFQKEHVRRMRSEGKSYSKIADCLGISENTIKSFCQRNNLGGMDATPKAEQGNIGKESFNFVKTVASLSSSNPVRSRVNSAQMNAA